MTILVVGAAGETAGLVVPALVERGASVRGLVRKPEQIQRAKDRGASEVMVGDLANPESLDAALADIESVFHIGPVFAPNEVQMGLNMIQAAQRAGVGTLVFSSVIHPILELPNHAAKALVERALVSSRMKYTILHPTMLFQNYAQSWASILETGVLAEPWASETRFSRVDYRDVADVAAIALTEDRLAYGTFELCAPGFQSRQEVAAILAEVLGREIGVSTVDRATLTHAPGDMITMFEHYDHAGLLGSALPLRTILGREPRTLRSYFEELAQ
ncbi:NmrA family NAD(P)-binding protein [Burkholderia sp. Bp8990]|uniref:NmrA family NAD(P)-binding protein n=1 Tax=Burkholderia sp. Bp8990 TaxID=2184552 RepID=UPI000F590B72|nr:NmrA family NAD(P)-binding protein [Burkholderia sp. Bp8990]RQS40960.1 NAD-dependent epimerase/dehydratase family protein [Burkholderia sp. Bp8990]